MYLLEELSAADLLEYQTSQTCEGFHHPEDYSIILLRSVHTHFNIAMRFYEYIPFEE